MRHKQEEWKTLLLSRQLTPQKVSNTFAEKANTLIDRLKKAHNRNRQHSVVSVDFHGLIHRIRAQPGEGHATSVASQTILLKCA